MLSRAHTPGEHGPCRGPQPRDATSLRCNQHEDLSAHQATQHPVPSHTWTPVLPTFHPQPPLHCRLPQALAPRRGAGRAEAELLPPVPQLTLLILWSFLLVLQVSVYLLVLRIAAHSHTLRVARYTHPHYRPLHAHVDPDGLLQLHAHTPVYTPISTCTHADSAPPKGAPPSITLPVFLEGHIVHVLLCSPLPCPPCG